MKLIANLAQSFLMYQIHHFIRIDPVKTPIWDEYKEIISRHDGRGSAAVGNIERFAFYEEAKTAYAIVATGEMAVYANVMLQKGVVTE